MFCPRNHDFLPHPVLTQNRDFLNYKFFFDTETVMFFITNHVLTQKPTFYS